MPSVSAASETWPFTRDRTRRSAARSASMKSSPCPVGASFRRSAAGTPAAIVEMETQPRRAGGAKDEIVAAGGYIDRCGDPAAMVADRHRGATEARIATEKMLIALDDHRPLVGDRRADAVGADARLAPDRPRPEAEPSKILVLARGAAAFERDTVFVGQQQAAPAPGIART